MNNNQTIPESRDLVPLRTLLAAFESGSRPKGGVKHIETGIPSLGGEHLNKNGGFTFDKIRYVPREFAANMKRGQIQKGDILVVKDGATTGKTSLVRGSFPYKEAVVNEHLFICRCKENIVPKYVFYFLFSLDGNQQILQDFRGAAQGGISQRFADIVQVPLTLFDEQKLIVAEIEKQFSRLDEAVAALKRIKANLKRYKASVLKAAVEGKLTEEWRKDHPDVEPAKELLERILVERRRKWEEAELEKMKAKVKEPKNDKWKKRYKEPELPKEEVFELPDTWKWSTLGQVSWSVKDGPHYSPKYSKTGIPFISGGNVRPEGIDFSNTKYISQELHGKLSERCKPEYGDLLYTKGGTTGIARINTETRDFNVWVHVAVLRLVDSLEKFYLQNALNSPHCYRQSQNYTHGVGNQDLGLTRMIWITLPLPPMEEQKEITIIIEERMSIIDEINKEIDLNLKRAERLRQSILKKAFSGKLVLQVMGAK